MEDVMNGYAVVNTDFLRHTFIQYRRFYGYAKTHDGAYSWVPIHDAEALMAAGMTMVVRSTMRH